LIICKHRLGSLATLPDSLVVSQQTEFFRPAAKLKMMVCGQLEACSRSTSDPPLGSLDSSDLYGHGGSLSEIVRQRRLRFAGHILRLPENRPAYKAMNWLPDNGKRRPGRPTKTWRATLKEDLQDMGLTWMGAKTSASDRQKWRKLVARCSGRNWRN